MVTHYRQQESVVNYIVGVVAIKLETDYNN